MLDNDQLTSWLLIGLLSVAMFLFIVFFVVLHLGYGLPLSALLLPAMLLGAAGILASAGLFLGTRRGAPVFLFAGLGVYCAVFICEGIYFASRLGYVSPARTPHLYAACMIILTADFVVSYYLYQYLRPTKKP